MVSRGDDALREYNSRFDGCERTSLQISREEIDAAYSQVSEEEINNMKIAASNIREFAKAQRRTVSELEDFSPMPGIMLGHRVVPLDSCCCSRYPGGGYPLYSTALMLGIPAKVAGVRRVAACSPVMKGTDHIHPKTLVAMDIAGIDEIYATGGAQAVAAFSYGTDQDESLSGSCGLGPGKQLRYGGPEPSVLRQSGDRFSGRAGSEVLVIADGSADPEIIAADLLAQSEHDREAKGITGDNGQRAGAARGCIKVRGEGAGNPGYGRDRFCFMGRLR